MPRALRRLLTVLLIFIFCLVSTQRAQANIGYVSDGKAAGVIIALVGVGVLIGFGVYYAVHHGHSLKGCATAGADGLQLLNEGDQRTYVLSGDVQGIKGGDRIRISGDKKNDGGAMRHFKVSKLRKDYGVCPAQP